MISVDESLLISFVIYFIALVILSLYPIRSKKPKSLYIKNCSGKFETFLLLKTNKFKNYPSGAKYFLKAIGNTALFTCFTLSIYQLYVKRIDFRNIQKQYDPLTISFSVILLVIILYWNERKNYLEKWEYLANLYNKSLEFELQSQRDVILTSLYHDIHLTEMWGHKTFYQIFSDAINEVRGKDEKLSEISNDEVEKYLAQLHSQKILKFKQACANALISK